MVELPVEVVEPEGVTVVTTTEVDVGDEDEVEEDDDDDDDDDEEEELVIDAPPTRVPKPQGVGAPPG